MNMNMKKKYLPFLAVLPLFFLAGCDDGDNDNDDGRAGKLEITIEDVQKHRLTSIIEFMFSGEGIGRQINPASEAGSGKTWDFSGMDLEKDIMVKIKTSSEIEKTDYAKSKYVEHFPDAKECYILTHKAYTWEDVLSSEAIHYDYYDGAKEFGGAQEYLGEYASANGIGKYTPALEEPYPQYLGLKFTNKFTVVRTTAYEGVSIFKEHLDTEIDGEGTVILPNGDVYNDVLRSKVTIYLQEGGTSVTYMFNSKKFGNILNLSEAQGLSTASIQYVNEFK
jgi:hypothetical protein